MTTEQLKAAAQDFIDVMKDLKDKGKPIVLTDDMTDKNYLKIITDAIPLIYPDDVFKPETLAVIEEIKNTPKESKKKVTAFVPEEVEEEVPANMSSLTDDIKKAERLKDLKDIAKAEPQFKSIVGILSGFVDLEKLRMVMLNILQKGEPPKEVKEELVVITKEAEVPVLNLPDQKSFLGKAVMKTSLIRTKTTFSSLFNINEKTLDDIIQNMKDYGYDPAFPLTLWGDVVIDGHTRLMAALTCEIVEVPVFQKEFASENEALQYAIHNQRARRNLSEAELLRCIEAIDKPMSKEEAGAKGGTSNLETKNTKIVPSHVETAETLGIGQSKVSDARTVLKDETAKKEVESGKKTIAAAAKDVREKNKPKKEKIAKEVLSAEMWMKKNEILLQDVESWSETYIYDFILRYAVYYHKNIK